MSASLLAQDLSKQFYLRRLMDEFTPGTFHQQNQKTPPGLHNMTLS